MGDNFPLGVPKKEVINDNYKEEEDEDEDEEEENIDGMNEDHNRSSHISYSSDYSIGYQTSSAKADLKKNATGKRLKLDDEEEDVKIESYIQRDPKSISVKDMRKLVPKLRIECFYTEQELSGKKKMKHLWDQRPSSWPTDVPFKDPNNPGKEGSTKKPGKSDLMKMYTYLREFYLKIKGLSFSSVVHSPASQAPPPQQQQQQQPQQQQQFHGYLQDSSRNYYYQSHPQLHQQHNPLPQQHFPQQFPQQMAYSPNGELVGLRKIAQPESMDEGQLIPSQVDPAVNTRMTNMSCTPPSPQGTNLTNGNITQEVQEGVKDEPFIIPNVVKDLYNRIASKVTAVISLPGVTDNVKEQLHQVIEEVLNPIYNLLTNTSFCLMYLDAGHQMEALLDCMIVLGKVEANLLSSGCIEIKKKFQNFEVWHVLSFISKSLPYLETNLAGATDCVKFRFGGNDNVIIPIDQRQVNLNNQYETDNKHQKLIMKEITPFHLGGFNDKIELVHKILNPVQEMIDYSANICNFEDDENELLSFLSAGCLNSDLDLTSGSDDNALDLQPDLSFVNDNQMPQFHPNHEHLYRINSNEEGSDYLLSSSTNPLLSCSNNEAIGREFVSFRGALGENDFFDICQLANISGGTPLQFTVSSSACNDNNYSNINSYISSNNYSNCNNFSSNSMISVSSGEQTGSIHNHVIPKFVEDMDCSDDYNPCNNRTSKQNKRKKK